LKYRFDECEFDTDAIRLVVAGEDVAVQPQVADVLRVLIEERSRVVSKEELLDRVWGHTFVTESALTSRIKSARQAIGDDGKEQRLIRTVHGRGYQFVGHVREDVDADPAAAAPAGRVASIAPLPTYASELVGRHRELAELARLVHGARIVTIVGPGGVGKTRLAVACAGTLTDCEVAFVDLTTVRDAALVVDHIATALGLHAAGDGAAAAIREYVEGRRTLLVVDNVEHVIDASPAIGELARGVDGLTVLATSRERLRVEGEQVFLLDPLDTNPESEAPDADPAAIELFVRTAHSVAPDLDLGRYRRHIEQICATVDGLPLAIELVAGQTRTLPPDMLAARLGDRLRSASATRRDAPARHRTMAETIDWSLRLLDRDERHLFVGLGAFVGDASLALIEAACTDEVVPDPLDVLTRLVDKSLVRARPGPDGQVRFGMLELLRTRAAELLADEPDALEVARRHAHAVADAVEAIDLQSWGTLASDWTDLLAMLLPEFRRAHDTATALEEWELVGRLAASYGTFWHREGGLPEGGRRIRAAREHADQLSRPTHGRLLAAAGLVAWDVGDVLEARELWLDAIELLEGTAFTSTMAYVMAGTAVTAIAEPERHDWAQDQIARALPIARSGPPAALAEVLNMWGEFARATGDDASARQAYEEALRLAADSGNRALESVALANLSYIECHAGNFDQARRMSRTALRMSIANGRRLMVSWTVGELAISAHGLGEHELAARLLGAATRAMQTLHAGRYPADVHEDERVIASLVERLGRAEYDRLFAEGGQLTLDQAIPLALGESRTDAP